VELKLVNGKKLNNLLTTTDTFTMTALIDLWYSMLFCIFTASEKNVLITNLLHR